MPCAELFQKKRLIEWEEEEQRRQQLEGNCIVAWWVHNSIPMDEGKHSSLKKFLQNYGVLETPTREQIEWDRESAIERVYNNPALKDIIPNIRKARRREDN